MDEVAAAALLYAVYFLILTYKSYKSFFHDFQILLPCGLAVCGAVFLLINGSMGFTISRKESRCQQGIFMYFIVVLLCLEASGVVLAYVYINRMDYELLPMQSAFERYNGSITDKEVDEIQKQLSCCGLHNYTDWKTTDWYKHSGDYRVPATCCNTTFVSCSGNITESNTLYRKGCFSKLYHRLNFYMSWMSWSCIAVIGVEVMAAIGDGMLMVQNPFRDFRILDSGAFA
ncbi:tetraspanin-3-like [Pelodytes ibericus]